MTIEFCMLRDLVYFSTDGHQNNTTYSSLSSWECEGSLAHRLERMA